jgi:hypothetical protein
MKFIIIILVSIVFPALMLNAQSTKDSAFYNPGIRMMERARTAEQYENVSRYFEEVSAQLPGQWLALYYTGLGYIHASYQVKEDVKKDQMLDRAQLFVDKAFKLKPGGPEIHVLQAFLYQSRMQVNPQLRGMTYSQKADASLKKAIAVEPSNPRAFSLMGYNVFYTPAVFGGGPKNALPLFLKARDKYLAFRPELPFSPMWGEQENQQMIKMCNEAKN